VCGASDSKRLLFIMNANTSVWPMGLYLLHANYELPPGSWINWHCTLVRLDPLFAHILLVFCSGFAQNLPTF
jgi:hypothetical protein